MLRHRFLNISLLAGVALASLSACTSSGPRSPDQGRPGAPVGGATPEQRAAQLTDAMRAKMALGDSLSAVVADINLEYAVEADGIARRTGDMRERAQRLRALQRRKDAEMAAILDKEQYATYRRLVDKMRPRRPNDRKRPGGHRRSRRP